MTENELKLIKEVHDISTAPLIQCREALILCNWDKNKSIKYLKYYPVTNIMDYWKNKKYCYCNNCDKFYIVSINDKICNCSYELEEF